MLLLSSSITSSKSPSSPSPRTKPSTLTFESSSNPILNESGQGTSSSSSNSVLSSYSFSYPHPISQSSPNPIPQSPVVPSPRPAVPRTSSNSTAKPIFRPISISSSSKSSSPIHSPRHSIDWSNSTSTTANHSDSQSNQKRRTVGSCRGRKAQPNTSDLVTTALIRPSHTSNNNNPSSSSTNNFTNKGFDPSDLKRYRISTLESHSHSRRESLVQSSTDNNHNCDFIDQNELRNALENLEMMDEPQKILNEAENVVKVQLVQMKRSLVSQEDSEVGVDVERGALSVKRNTIKGEWGGLYVNEE